MRRLLKWALVAFVLAEWYTRGGREFLFGEPAPDGIPDEFRIWIDLTPGTVVPRLPVLLKNGNGVYIGRLTEVRPKPDARDYAGFPIEQSQVKGEFVRAWFGHPINVAIAEAEDLARRTLSGVTL